MAPGPKFGGRDSVGGHRSGIESGLPRPKYTPIAEKARIEVRVELALLIEPSGEVACAEVIKGLRMGLTEECLETALNWQLAAAPGWDGPRQIRVVLEGRLTVRKPSFD